MPIHPDDVKRCLPSWFRQEIPDPYQIKKLKEYFSSSKIHTVCQSARCPNLGFCWTRGTATFMLLGGVCTRACRFCSVQSGRPERLNPDEPLRVAEAVKQLRLDYVVLTSVTRDDLEDQGAGQFVLTVQAIRRLNPGIKVELLIPDFSGREDLLKEIIGVNADVVGHNIETVQRLYPLIRPQASYDRALRILKLLKEAGTAKVKSGLMLGLGETKEEVFQTIKEVTGAGCGILSVGQYLAPAKTERHVPVRRFIPPEEFDEYREAGLKTGLSYVMSGPVVRSSFMAEEAYQKAQEGCH